MLVIPERLDSPHVAIAYGPFASISNKAYAQQIGKWLWPPFLFVVPAQLSIFLRSLKLMSLDLFQDRHSNCLRASKLEHQILH